MNTSVARAARREMVAMLLVLGVAQGAFGDELEDAQKAARELRFADARSSVAAALKRPGHSRRELIDLYALDAELIALLDGTDAGERAFRKLLAIDPSHAPPVQRSPVYRAPFERAHKWIAENGALAVEHTPPALARPGQPTPLELRITHNVLSMIASARLTLRHAGGDDWEIAETTGLSLALPAAKAGEVLEYYVEVLDRTDNTLLELGSADAPFQVEVVAAPTKPVVAAPPRADPAIVSTPTRPRRLWPYGLGSGVAAVSFLGVAIGLNLAANAENDRLAGTCAPGCTASDLGALHAEKAASIAFYSLTGAAAITAIVLFAVDYGTRR